MDKYIIIRFTPYLFQSTTLPKWMFFPKLLFKSSLLLNMVSAAYKYIPHVTATAFAFSSVFILFLWFRYRYIGRLESCVGRYSKYSSLSLQWTYSLTQQQESC